MVLPPKLSARVHDFFARISSRWIVLSASIIVNLALGTMYDFSLYSGELKEALNISQGDLQLIATCLNIGSFFAIPAGLFVDKYGPRLAISIGVVLLSIGFLPLYFASQGVFEAPLWLLVIFSLVGGNAIPWFDDSVVVATVSNFPKQRAAVLGILNSLLGISASVQSLMYSAFIAPNALDFILYIGLGMSIVLLVAMPFMQVLPRNTGKNRRHDPAAGWTERRITYLNTGVLTLAGILLLIVIVGGTAPISERAYKGIASGVIFIIFSLMAVPFLWRHKHNKIIAGGEELSNRVVLTQSRDEEAGGVGELENGPEADDQSSISSSSANVNNSTAPSSSVVIKEGDASSVVLPVVSADDLKTKRGGGELDIPVNMSIDASISLNDTGRSANATYSYNNNNDVAVDNAVHGRNSFERNIVNEEADVKKPAAASGVKHEEKESATYLQAVRDIRLWVMFFVYACNGGLGLMLTNNTGQIVQALSGDADDVSRYVSAFSVSSALGRLGMGMISQRTEGKISRPTLLFFAMTLMGAAHAILIRSSLSLLFPAEVLCGLSYGAFWMLLPMMSVDMFGLAHLGAIVSTVTCAPCIGSIAISQQLATWSYSRSLTSDTEVCLGVECYQPAFTINAIIAAVSCGGCLWLALMTRRMDPLHHPHGHRRHHDEKGEIELQQVEDRV